MPRIYIAGPLLHGHTSSDDVGFENMFKTLEIGWKLMQKGWSPYIPHYSMVMYKHLKDKFKIDVPWEKWMEMDSAYITQCTAIYFIGHSKGADIELAWAMDNGLVLYTAIDDVPNVKPDRCLLDE